MNQNTDIALKQAFDFIEGGNLEDARDLLRPILETEKDNADVWWLYSHAVTDPETARLALNNVLRIDPDYPDARDLLNQLEVQQKAVPADDIPEIDKDPSFIPAMPSSIPGITPLPPRPETSKVLDAEDELPEDLIDEEEPEGFYRRPVFYVPVIVLLLLIALAIVILKPFALNSPVPESSATVIPTALSSALEVTPTTEALSGGEPTATLEGMPTEGLVVPTKASSEATEVVTIPTEVNGTTEIPAVPTEIGATSEAVDGFADVSNALTGFTLASDGAPSIASTNLGQTLTTGVCTTAGREMRETLPKVMEAIAKVSPNYASQAQAVAVKLEDCSATPSTTLLWIGANIADATSFAGGTLADKDFQAKWQPVK